MCPIIALISCYTMNLMAVFYVLVCWMQQVENVPVIEEGTRRLAVVNMDWRHVRVMLSNF